MGIFTTCIAIFVFSLFRIGRPHYIVQLGKVFKKIVSYSWSGVLLWMLEIRYVHETIQLLIKWGAKVDALDKVRAWDNLYQL